MYVTHTDMLWQFDARQTDRQTNRQTDRQTHTHNEHCTNFSTFASLFYGSLAADQFLTNKKIKTIVRTYINYMYNKHTYL